MATIIFVGGGTLGHIYPAIPVIKAWKKKHPNDFLIYIACKKSPEQKLLSLIKEIDQCYFFPLRGLAGKNLIKKAKVLACIVKDNIKMRKIIKLHKPALVVGMGGSISGLFLRLSHKEKCPIIIHEQNTLIGKANKWSLKWADYFLTAFSLPPVHPRQKWIGNPRFDEAKKLSNKASKPIGYSHILIVSGSLGAKIINKTAIAFLKCPQSLGYSTTLITGNRYYDECVQAVGAASKPHYQIIPFSDNLLELMKEANVIVSRAGGTTMFEILGLNKPMILIPSDNVSDGHQLSNALCFAKENLAFVIDEKNLTLETFLSCLNRTWGLKKDPSNPYLSLKATEDFIAIIEKVLKR